LGIARPYSEVRNVLNHITSRLSSNILAWVRAEREQGRYEDFPINPQLTYVRKMEWVARALLLARLMTPASIVVHSEDVNIPNRVSLPFYPCHIVQIFGLKKPKCKQKGDKKKILSPFLSPHSSSWGDNYYHPK
jgi:hypothetical protein